jgi:hypothetical protein
MIRRNGVTTTAVSLSPQTGRSHLQESLFAWFKPETPSVQGKAAQPPPEPAPAKEPLAQPLRESAPEGPSAVPEPETKSGLSHTWVVAATIEVTPKVASVVDYRGSFKATEDQRIEALDVYCDGCRRPYDEVKEHDCAAKIDNTDLIGGDQSKRAKQSPAPTPNARNISGGTINRHGIGAHMSRASRPPC